MQTAGQRNRWAREHVDVLATPKRKRGLPFPLAILVSFAVGAAMPLIIVSADVPGVLRNLNMQLSDTGSSSTLVRVETSARFDLCSGRMRVTCVVDGDTIWYEGTKIRIADLNTPETGQPECAEEAALGRRATNRLAEILNAGPFEVRNAYAERDEDQYGRKLRLIYRNGSSISRQLIAEGLAHNWEGYRQSWC